MQRPFLKFGFQPAGSKAQAAAGDSQSFLTVELLENLL